MSTRQGSAGPEPVDPAIVSVIIAYPSRGPTSLHGLAASIDSVLSQTLRGLEAIVVGADDDGRVAALLARYEDARLLSFPLRDGPVWAQAVAIASGRYIALLEPGDISMPPRLACQTAYMDAHPEIDVLGSASRCMHNGLPSAIRTGTPVTSSLMLRAPYARGLDGGLPFDVDEWRSRAGGGFAALDGALVVCADPSPPPELPDRELHVPGRLFSTVYAPYAGEASDPPTLFVVVDTEAEFDWAKPFARELNSVSAMDDIERGQAVFDPYGLRPIYAVDYPVATQVRGFARLRAILERDGCEIGAHLHPWTTPPFEEALSARNSYPGNLDPGLEERKLALLIAAIKDSFGISPVFYKAGRYGFGPATARALVRHGIKVDLSVLPGADLRRQGGPDFRALKPIPYRIGDTDILTLPMTRSEVGLLPFLGGLGAAVQNFPGGALLRLPSVLARLRLADTITLTPEGVTADEQVRLIRAMLKRGHRQFVLHYHSPSLSPGNTPYAKDRPGAETLIARLQHVCRFFFDEIGGIPGYPRDLLRVLC